MNNTDIAKSLNKIVAFLHDSQVCYKDHVEHVTQPELKKLFGHIASLREKMIKDLTAEISSLGEVPSQSGTLLGQSHRIYENLKSLITSGDPLAIAKEIRRGESILIQYYQEAIRANLPKSLQEKLMAHLGEIENNLKGVDQLAALS
jgi:uncharacterized protein (TIGR02284 family)